MIIPFIIFDCVGTNYIVLQGKWKQEVRVAVSLVVIVGGALGVSWVGAICFPSLLTSFLSRLKCQCVMSDQQNSRRRYRDAQAE